MAHRIAARSLAIALTAALLFALAAEGHAFYEVSTKEGFFGVGFGWERWDETDFRTASIVLSSDHAGAGFNWELTYGKGDTETDDYFALLRSNNLFLLPNSHLWRIFERGIVYPRVSAGYTRFQDLEGTFVDVGIGIGTGLYNKETKSIRPDIYIEGSYGLVKFKEEFFTYGAGIRIPF